MLDRLEESLGGCAEARRVLGPHAEASTSSASAVKTVPTREVAENRQGRYLIGSTRDEDGGVFQGYPFGALDRVAGPVFRQPATKRATIERFPGVAFLPNLFVQ